MNWKRQIIAVLAALCVLCVLSGAAYANEVPDLKKTGSITVTMKYGGKAVKGGTLTLYRVGEIHEDDGNYSFVKTAEMADFSGDYADLSGPDLAKEVAAFVKDNQIKSRATAKNENGTAVFSNLEPGLYLIVQTRASTGYEPINPFLVSVPYNQDGHYVYDITAESKMELRQEPKPTTPKEDTLAQTGQLNWPVPVLAVLGLALLLVGFALRFGKKDMPNEK